MNSFYTHAVGSNLCMTDACFNINYIEFNLIHIQYSTPISNFSFINIMHVHSKCYIAGGGKCNTRKFFA